MTTLLWAVPALIAAMAIAMKTLVNEYFKVNPAQFLWWMRLFNILALLPAAFFIPCPVDPLFYVFVISGGVLFAYYDVILHEQTAENGAGVVSRIMALSVGAMFILWTAITPSLALEYLGHPLRSAGILGALGGGIYFALKLRHCEISLRALRRMFPAMLLAAIGVVLGKLAMNHAQIYSGVVYYALVQSVTVFCIYMLTLKIPALSRRVHAPQPSLHSFIRDKRILAAGACSSVFWITQALLKWFAIWQVENPAYVTMIGLSGPLWILLVYKLAGRKETANIWPGLGIVACALLLVAFTSL